MVENKKVAPCLRKKESRDTNRHRHREHTIDSPSEKRTTTASTGSSEVNMKYFNNAGQARLSENVQAAGIRSIQLANSTHIHADDDQRRVRSLFATLIDADASRIAIVPSTAFAITMAAENIFHQLYHVGSSRIDEAPVRHILLLEDQYNSAVYPWQRICEKSGGKLKLRIVAYPSSSGKNCDNKKPSTAQENGQQEDWTSAVLKQLDDTITVACLPPLHWSDGSLLDLPKISTLCRKLGITLIVDSTQATGIMKTSVKDIQPAMMACSVHKWLRGPSGYSLVYISPEVQSTWMPLDQHARGRENPKEWDAPKGTMGPDGYPEIFYSDARKFDAGGKPNSILLPMLRTSLEEVVSLDLSKAQDSMKTSMEPLIEWAAHSNQYSVPSEPHAWHIVGIRPKHLKPHKMVDIAEQLQRDHGIYLAVRCGAFRIAPYVDTTKEDVTSLIKALEKY